MSDSAYAMAVITQASTPEALRDIRSVCAEPLSARSEPLTLEIGEMLGVLDQGERTAADARQRSWHLRDDAFDQFRRARQRLEDVHVFSSRRRHTRFDCDWSSDVCSSD